jgi:hypothetical protein
VSNWEVGKTQPNAGEVARMAEILKCNHRWLLIGEGEPDIAMVAAGSVEEYTRDVDVDVDVDGDLPLEYWRDRGLLERWIGEENAILLYRITREELTMLEGIPILGFEDREESYGEIYRACLVMHRKKRMGKPQRHKDTEELKLKVKS